jgi:hypothetical protein
VFLTDGSQNEIFASAVHLWMQWTLLNRDLAGRHMHHGHTPKSSASEHGEAFSIFQRMPTPKAKNQTHSKA